MILNTQHFSGRIEEINHILWKKKFDIYAFQRMAFKKFEKEKIQWHYTSTFLNFPLEIENSSNNIGISIFATELLDLYYDCVEGNRSLSSQKSKELFEKRKTFIPDDNIETIEFFIDAFFTSLVYNYQTFLANTMAQHYFVGINDEVKILLNILKRYKSVLLDKAKQIDVFWSIKLNKEISDHIIEMLIDFIEQRLNLLTISSDHTPFESKINHIENDIFKIEWNGSQQELCELILELENKEWISNIKNGDRRKVANSITNIFDLTQTKKNTKSDPSNSFYQLLKGEHDKNQRTFPFLEKETYEKKFNKIVNRKTS
ncbi:hypothetical protein BFP72_14170 [Reichenbachiella sp. 5M10]|uniref:hypothetical protein n=1 Tax=Reichenbachiella sp. 5M10 TaxID=1889772 RepID=UPI000C14E7D7|nr:hypothetical protein [Reichenbachiella sp. 5M10]PIB36460.1 hypothetical protein BFP72_14170 [Reichenbachiella sp. 5M10]